MWWCNWHNHSFPIAYKCLIDQVVICWIRCSASNASSWREKLWFPEICFNNLICEWLTRQVSSPLWLLAVWSDISVLVFHHSQLLGWKSWIFPALVAQSEEPPWDSRTFGYTQHCCCKNEGTLKLLLVHMKCSVYRGWVCFCLFHRAKVVL